MSAELREKLETARPNRIREAAYILADQWAKKGWLKIEPCEYSVPDMICDAMYSVVAEIIESSRDTALAVRTAELAKHVPQMRRYPERIACSCGFDPSPKMDYESSQNSAEQAALEAIKQQVRTEVIEELRRYKPHGARACPLCIYENGKFIKECVFHRENEQVRQAALREAAEHVPQFRGSELYGSLMCTKCGMVSDAALPAARYEAWQQHILALLEKQ
jgi:hypothetical protein